MNEAAKMIDYDKILAAAALIEGFDDDVEWMRARVGKENALYCALFEPEMDTDSFFLVRCAAKLMLGQPCRSPITTDDKLLKSYEILARHLGASITVRADNDMDGIQLCLDPTGYGRLN
jgi:hypothetical protein